MKTIDACGYSCPQPVLKTKNALADNPDGVQVVVDSVTAKDNVERYLKQLGYSITIAEEEDTYKIEARK